MLKKCIYNLKAVVSKANLKTPDTPLVNTGEQRNTENPILHASLCSSQGQAHVFCWLAGWLPRFAVSWWLRFRAVSWSRRRGRSQLLSTGAPAGASRCRAQALGHGRGICGPGLSCSESCEIFPEQGSNPCLCIGRTDLYPWTTREVLQSAPLKKRLCLTWIWFQSESMRSATWNSVQ